MSVRARTYVCECRNPLLLNLYASLSFLIPQFFQATTGVRASARVYAVCGSHILVSQETGI